MCDMFHNINIYIFLEKSGVWEYQEISFNARPQITTLKAFVLTVFSFGGIAGLFGGHSRARPGSHALLGPEERNWRDVCRALHK